MRSKTDSGFSLLEALLTMLLFAIALAVTAQLLNGSKQLVNKASGRSKAVRSSQWALATIRERVEMAQRVIEPAAGPSNNLKLICFRSDMSDRLPDPLPNWRSTDPYWLPFDPSFLESTEFYRSDDRLMERTDGAEVFLTDSVQQFEVENLDHQIQIKLVIGDGSTTVEFLTRMVKP